VGICEIILKGLVTFLAAVGAAWVGVRIFFRQKEYEIVKNRYLDCGVDLVVTELENNLGILDHNWARSLNIVKSFRDTKELFDVSELDKGFIELDSSQFQVVANHRLDILVGSKIYWEVFQSAQAFVSTSNSIITKEVTNTIRLKLTTDKVTKTTDELAEYLFKLLKGINEDSHRYANLQHKLLRVADILEREKLSFNKVEEFRHKPEICKITQQLKDEYAKELSIE